MLCTSLPLAIDLDGRHPPDSLREVPQSKVPLGTVGRPNDCTVLVHGHRSALTTALPLAVWRQPPLGHASQIIPLRTSSCRPPPPEDGVPGGGGGDMDLQISPINDRRVNGLCAAGGGHDEDVGEPSQAVRQGRIDNPQRVQGLRPGQGRAPGGG